jgi:hypothetical protein
VLAETGLELPMLWSLGLGRIMGRDAASWGRMRERSAGKDSTTTALPKGGSTPQWHLVQTLNGV